VNAREQRIRRLALHDQRFIAAKVDLHL